MRDQILEDLKNAMKNREKDTLAVIRMLKGALQMEELNLKRQATDDEVISIVTKQIKTRKESINEFKKGKREDLVQKTESEIKILEKYLPKQLSKDEVCQIIDEAFNQINPTSIKDMGKIMKEITPKIRGRYEMGEVSKIVKEKLEN